MMRKAKIDVFDLLQKVREKKPVVHHLTNWVTIYDCANVVKVLGASPVMAHAKEEVAEMARIASALVLNIGTLTVDFVEAMKIAAKSANEKGIPVVLDACGCGATQLRDQKTFELLEDVKINILKGNASEIAKAAGENVKTKGVDAAKVEKDLIEVARHAAKKYKCTVVITGSEDIIAGEKQLFIVKNGHEMMSHVVGTGCMAASVIGAFAAVEKNLALAAASGLVCFEIGAECAVKDSAGPGTFKERLFDVLFNLDKKTIDRMQQIYS
jgi:hydroxyethylthiazole kinase